MLKLTALIWGGVFARRHSLPFCRYSLLPLL